MFLPALKCGVVELMATLVSNRRPANSSTVLKYACKLKTIPNRPVGLRALSLARVAIVMRRAMAVAISASLSFCRKVAATGRNHARCFTGKCRMIYTVGTLPGV